MMMSAHTGRDDRMTNLCRLILQIKYDLASCSAGNVQQTFMDGVADGM